MNRILASLTLSMSLTVSRRPCRVRVVKSEEDVLVVCPTILTEDGMQAQHLGATLALYRLVKGQVRLPTSRASETICGVAALRVCVTLCVRARQLCTLNVASVPARSLLAASPDGPVAV